MWNRKRIQTYKVLQGGGVDTNVPLLKMHLMTRTKMRMISTDTTTTTTITHSHKYFLRASEIILLKHRSQNQKETSKITTKKSQRAADLAAVVLLSWGSERRTFTTSLFWVVEQSHGVILRWSFLRTKWVSLWRWNYFLQWQHWQKNEQIKQNLVCLVIHVNLEKTF